MTEARADTKVRKRSVFYVMGFDPRGIPFYHGQLRREARISRRRGFSSLEVGPLKPEWEHGQMCQCRNLAEGRELELDYHFLSISDFVAAYFKLPLLTRLGQAIRLLVHNFASGFLCREMVRRPKFTLFILYPYGVLALGPLLGLVAGLMVAHLHGTWSGLAAGLIVTVLGAAYVLKNEHRFYAMYLLGDFLFSTRALTAPPQELTLRMQAFKTRIMHALQDARPDEEIVIVGHSSGALLAIELAADVVRSLPNDTQSKISLLTLGNQASLADMSGTHAFRQDVASVLESRHVYWCDVFAPQDVISSGRFDFAEQLKKIPIKSNTYDLRSARLKETLHAPGYARLKYSFLKLHMQYLRASETGNGFNYYALLESPLRLRDFRY
jgi:hypothetical protein